MAHHLLKLLPPLLVLVLVSAHAQASPPPSPVGRRSAARSGPSTPPPAPQIPSPVQEFLDVHNQARAQVGVGPLRWGPALANATALLATYQRVKNNCQFADVSSDRIKYGANQLWAKGVDVTPRMAVGAWVAEKQYYKYGDDSCAPNHHCGVYKQVVWRNSVELGCAQARCAKDGSSLTLCFYNPPGNIVGEKPYSITPSQF